MGFFPHTLVSMNHSKQNSSCDDQRIELKIDKSFSASKIIEPNIVSTVIKNQALRRFILVSNTGALGLILCVPGAIILTIIDVAEIYQ